MVTKTFKNHAVIAFLFSCFVSAGALASGNAPSTSSSINAASSITQPGEVFNVIEKSSHYCKHRNGTINFCSSDNIKAFYSAPHSTGANFSHHYAVAAVPFRAGTEMPGYIIAVVDTKTNDIYVPPFDIFYPEHFPSRSGITFSQSENQLCLKGGLLVRHTVVSGKHCFLFVDGQWRGYVTPYNRGHTHTVESTSVYSDPTTDSSSEDVLKPGTKVFYVGSTAPLGKWYNVTYYPDGKFHAGWVKCRKLDACGLPVRSAKPASR